MMKAKGSRETGLKNRVGGVSSASYSPRGARSASAEKIFARHCALKRPWTHRLAAVILVLVLALTPVFSPLEGLFSFLVSAASEDSGLPERTSPGFYLTNKRYPTGTEYLYANAGESIYHKSRSGGAYLAGTREAAGRDCLRGNWVEGGKGNWSMVFKSKSGLNTEDIVDLQYCINAYATIAKGGYMTMGDGTTTVNITSSGSCSTGWNDYTEDKVVITGYKASELSRIYYFLGDLTAPGDKGWNYSITMEDGTPTIWLDSHELLYGADSATLSDVKSNLKIKIGLVPADNQSASVTYVTATAIGLNDTETGIGFQIKDSDWNNWVAGTRWLLVSVSDASSTGKYTVRMFFPDYYSRIASAKDRVVETTIAYPLCDLAGNPISLPSGDNIRSQRLYIDAEPPGVGSISMSGSSIDESVTESADGWPDDTDRSSIISVVGDYFTFKLKLTEQMKELTEDELAQITLTTNCYDENGNQVVLYATGMENTYANGSNGEMVTILSFSSARFLSGWTPEGVRIRPLALNTAGLISDTLGNVADDVIDLSGIYPDKETYFDDTAPTVEIGTVVYVGEGQYTIPVTISDGDGITATVVGQTGRMAITTSRFPLMDYEYTIDTSAAWPDTDDGTLENIGTLGSTKVWSDFQMTKEGTYYVHLQINGTEGVEISDSKGINLYFVVQDAVGNVSEAYSKTITELDLDDIMTDLSISSSKTKVVKSNGTNTATFTASATAEDINGIARIECQWVEGGEEPAENAWEVLKQYTDSSTAPTYEICNNITTSISATETVSRDLYVRAYDTHGNYLIKSVSFSADLSKTVSRYEVSGDPTTPSADTAVTVYHPVDTEGSTTGEAWTRAMITVGGNTYVRVFYFEENDGTEETSYNLFDFSSGVTWYQVTLDSSNSYYLDVDEVTLDAASLYGNLSVTFASSSAYNLTPAAGAALESRNDTTYQAEGAFSIKYAPQHESVHKVTFNSVTDSAGTAVSSTTSGGYTYYRMNLSMTGLRIAYSLSNTLVSGWKVQDVDFENSYAVLVSVNSDGTLVTDEDGNLDTGSELTERMTLSSGTSQIFSIPATDKDGNAFGTGAYAIYVHIVQNGGAEQDFSSVDSGYTILLDDQSLPTRFGVFSYTTTTDVLYDASFTRTTTAEDGDVLGTISVGVAEPYRDGKENLSAVEKNTSLYYVDGAALYTTEDFNGTANITNDGKFMLNIQAEADKETWLGASLGSVEGIRIWNAASSGSGEDLAYYSSSNMSSDMWFHYSSSKLTVTLDLNWYGNSSGCDIVDEDTLAATDVSDFKLTMGSNIIYYQLIMENGLESPVYSFQINLCDELPEVEYSVVPGEGTVVLNNNGYYEKHIDQVDVSLTDAFSPYGDITLYYAQYNYNTSSWDYTAYDAGDTITMTNSSSSDGSYFYNVQGEGYYGAFSTSYDSYGRGYTAFQETAFVFAIDNVGNAVGMYPIFGSDWSPNDADNTFYYYFSSYSEELSATCEATGDGDDSYEISLVTGNVYSSFGTYVDYVTVEIDDRKPVQIDVSGLESIDYDDSNSAGLLGYTYEKLYDEDGYSAGISETIRLVLPYEKFVGDGETTAHTVKVTAYGYEDLTGSRTVTELLDTSIVVVNTAPTVEIDSDGTIAVGSVPVTANTYLRETGIYGNAFAMSFGAAAYTNGTYELNVEDKYGQTYTFELDIEGMDEDPAITYSETEYTTEDVIVTVHTDNYSDSLTVQDSNGLVTDGTLAVDTSTLSESGDLVLTFSDNGTVYIQYETASGVTVSCPVTVDNIIELVDVEPYIFWSYDESMIVEVDNVAVFYGSVTAYLMDRNGTDIIDPQTGEAPQYTFVPGAVEGDTYTFSGYTDIYGNTIDDITATLACNLLTGEGYESTDVYSPDLAITGYSISQSGTSKSYDAVYTLENDRPEDDYYGLSCANYEYRYESVYTDIDDLLNQMGWAKSYLFRIASYDENNVKLFIKEEAYGEIPDYDTGESDTIEGVSIVGQTITVTENVEFTLYAVDSEGNYSAVRFGVENLGDVPIPQYSVVMENGGSQAKVFLMYPNISGVKDLTLTYASASSSSGTGSSLDIYTEDDETSDYYGFSYVLLEEDATVLLYWSYSYGGETYTYADVDGALEVTVSGIDTDPPVLSAGYPLWSANYDSEGDTYTNQEISVQFDFDKTIAQVYVVTKDDKEAYLTGTDVTLSDIAACAQTLELWQAETGTTVNWLDNRITIVYTENADGYYLVAASANGRYFAIDLPAVTTIDCEAAVATLSEVSYSDNAKTAQCTITVNETVSLQETAGLVKVDGELVRTGTSFTLKFTENGTYTYHVADKGGNITEVSIVVDSLVTEPLSIALSSDANGETILNPATAQIDIGDVIYVQVNRAATIYLNGTEVAETSVGVWTAVTITEDSEGMYPIIKAADAYGNSAVAQLLYISVKDRVAPTIVVSKNVVSVSIDSTEEEIDAVLLQNIIYSDNSSAVADLTVDIAYDLDGASAGTLIPVTYTVTDEDGNAATASCSLKLKRSAEPVVYVLEGSYEAVDEDDLTESARVEWEDAILVDGDTVTLVINTSGEQYKVDYKSGIKTVAQLKNGAASVCGYTTETTQTITLKLGGSGYYTFVVTTQEHETYRFLVYVKE